MIVRQADPSDFDTMARIWLESSRAGHPFLGEAVLEEQLLTVQEVYFLQAQNWVAEDCGSVLGFIGLLGGHVGGLFVDPAAHRRGVGRRLIEHAAGRHVTLTVEVYQQNESAVSFYLRCGFVQIGRRATDDEGRPFPLLQLRRVGPADVRN